MAAAARAARFLGIDQLGLVASGKNAEFLVLDANPSTDHTPARLAYRIEMKVGVLQIESD